MKKAIENIKRELKKRLNLKKNWKIEVETKPYDVIYKVEKKKIKITIISPNYLEAWKKKKKELIKNILLEIPFAKRRIGKIKTHEGFEREPYFIQLKCEWHPLEEWLDIEYWGNNKIRIESHGSLIIDLDRFIEILKDFKKKLVVYSL